MHEARQVLLSRVYMQGRAGTKQGRSHCTGLSRKGRLARSGTHKAGRSFFSFFTRFILLLRLLLKKTILDCFQVEKAGRRFVQTGLFIYFTW